MNLDPKLMEIIVCPDCHGALAPVGEELVCQQCGLAYPVRDDIPVLLVDEARRPADGLTTWRPGSTSPGSTTRPRSRRPTCACASSPRRAPASAARRWRPHPASPPRWRPRETPRGRGPSSRPVPTHVSCGRCSSRGARCRSWPGRGPALPGWAGALDLVVVLAPDGTDRGTAAAVAEAVRRGCQVVVACPAGSLVAEHSEGRWSTIVPTVARDQLATAVVLLEYLDQVGLGPRADHGDVADALDDVAVVVLAAPRPGRQPRQDAGDRARRHAPGRVGRVVAGRARGPSRRRDDPPGVRPVRDRRRRRAPAPVDRGRPAPRRLRRPLRRRRRRRPADAARVRRRHGRRRSCARTTSGCAPRRRSTAYASRR